MQRFRFLEHHNLRPSIYKRIQLLRHPPLDPTRDPEIPGPRCANPKYTTKKLCAEYRNSNDDRVAT